MAPSFKGKGSAIVNLNLKGQNEKVLQDIVGRILEFAGCAACGRLARLHFEFLGDPPRELITDQVASFESTGFAG